MKEVVKIDGLPYTREWYGTLNELNALKADTGVEKPIGSIFYITDSNGTLGDAYMWDGVTFSK
jgi:hypothetical protein